MNNQRYLHTQTGWAIIAAMIAVAAISLPIIVELGADTLPLVFITAILLLMAMFSTLTVVVDNTHLSYHFTFALIGKRIALEDVRHYKCVRNPWYYGWGIHLYPGGVLYNVSGLQALEIMLNCGKCLRIGTDEPGPLYCAVEAAIGAPEPLSPQEQAQMRSAKKKSLILIFGILLVVLTGIALVAYLVEQPPRVTLTEQSFNVEAVFYGEQFALEGITGVSLCQRIPRILARTNGCVGGRTLRGHFRLARLDVQRSEGQWSILKRQSALISGRPCRIPTHLNRCA